jgi:hypothetical protein
MDTFTKTTLLIAFAAGSAVNASAQLQIIGGAFSWHEALADAVSRGGRLAVLDSQEKIDFTKTFLLQNSNEARLWIGLTDEDSEGQWKWVTGEILSYSHWEAGEPNNSYNTHFGPILFENYAELLPDSSALWNDQSSGARNGYLLEVGNGNGFTSVPEPASAVTMTGVIMGIMAMCRRRRKA